MTLNILKRRKDRRTETPNDSSGLKCVQNTSNIEPKITFEKTQTSSNYQKKRNAGKHTTKSNILNEDAKY